MDLSRAYTISSIVFTDNCDDPVPCSLGHTLPAAAGTSRPAELVGGVLTVLPSAGRLPHGHEGHGGVQEDPERRAGEYV